MMTDRQAETILMGAALMESIGNLYQYVGSDGRKLYFRNVANGTGMQTTYEQMLTECSIQY